MITRICNDCRQEKVLADLVKASACKYGRRKLCRACLVKRQQERYDPLSKSEYDRKRRKIRSKELREYDRERSKLPHRRAAHNEGTRKRRAMMKNAVPEDYDREGVLAMYALAQKFSKLTGIEMHVDHIQPISKGGEHNVENLQLLAAPLNLAKGASEDFQLSWEAYP